MSMAWRGKFGPENAEDSDESMLSVPDDARVKPIGRNVYALLISDVTQDYVRLWQGSANQWVRICRLGYSAFLMFLVILLQVFLLYGISTMLCGPSVKEIRQAYSLYEKALYGAEVEETVNGFWRGKTGAVPNEEAFSSLSSSDQAKICNIPLSQPLFTASIVFIWTLTCIAEVRSASILAYDLLWVTPIAPVTQCLDHGPSNRTIVGLTRGMKASLCMGCFLPRICAALLLNLLGCHWILSSTDLPALFLDALALEFIVLLPELLYRTFASERSMLRTQSTFVQAGEIVEVSVMDILHVFMWGIFAILWTYIYMFHLQPILPGYRWDVHKVCAQQMK